ncbi:unnamed protein product [Leuciscus chuanchicus]
MKESDECSGGVRLRQVHLTECSLVPMVAGLHPGQGILLVTPLPSLRLPNRTTIEEAARGLYPEKQADPKLTENLWILKLQRSFNRRGTSLDETTSEWTAEMSDGKILA